MIDFHNESVDLLKYNQDKNFNDKKFTNLDSITVKRDSNSNNEITNKKYFGNMSDKNTILRFNQTLEK